VIAQKAGPASGPVVLVLITYGPGTLVLRFRLTSAATLLAIPEAILAVNSEPELLSGFVKPSLQ
jgi:hypothetical protein